jgi:hypothetical protein
VPANKLVPNRYCSDRCYQEARAGKLSYAPCPLVNPARYLPPTCACTVGGSSPTTERTVETVYKDNFTPPNAVERTFFLFRSAGKFSRRRSGREVFVGLYHSKGHVERDAGLYQRMGYSTRVQEKTY